MGFHGDLAEAFTGADDQGEGQGCAGAAAGDDALVLRHRQRINEKPQLRWAELSRSTGAVDELGQSHLCHERKITSGLAASHRCARNVSNELHLFA